MTKLNSVKQDIETNSSITVKRVIDLTEGQFWTRTVFAAAIEPVWQTVRIEKNNLKEIVENKWPN